MSKLTEINNELDDLEPSDPLLPPNTNATRALEVVPVHENVYRQVQGDDNPGHRGTAEQLRVAQDSSGAMVVAVKEGFAKLY